MFEQWSTALCLVVVFGGVVLSLILWTLDD